MNMIGHHLHRINPKLTLLSYLPKQFLHPFPQLSYQDVLSIFWNPSKMIFDIVSRLRRLLNCYAVIYHTFCGFGTRTYIPALTSGVFCPGFINLTFLG